MFVHTNGTVRQQTGRWHRRQNKFGKASAVSGSTERSPNGMGTDKSHNSVSGELLQLDLAA
ncbi:MAG: hypothetical protein KME05_24685 [Gloeocapsa sp. UFS-A4-WI-NPMV-4B04]|nr:hypothetical protein [Gloeocapsa sp. UFS-A4-WI-NPMV-4B04]